MSEPSETQRPSLGRVGVVALLLLLVLGIGFGASELWKHRARPIDRIGAAGPQGIPVPPNLPGMQMAEVQAIAPEEAKKLNEAVPFVEEAAIPAKPFRLGTGTADGNRATDCLAAAVYFEAGAETDDGQMAVAQVVLNRMRHPAYPKTVCGVVFQGAERTDRLCQFTFACDGSLGRTPSAGGWARARSVAVKMLTGAVYKPVGWATHYHTDWVFPSWSKKLDKVRREGTHLFFRWQGFWGTPGAFRTRYAGGEINVGKLAGLSPFHIPDPTMIDPMLSGTTIQGVTADGEIVNQPLIVPKNPSSLPPPPAFAKLAFSNAAGDLQVYQVGTGIEPEALLSLSMRSCGERDYCKILMWTDRSAMPSGLPIPDAALGTLAFSYLRNRSTGFEKPLWDCATFKRQAVGQCIKHNNQMGRQGEAPRPKQQVQPAPVAPQTDLNMIPKAAGTAP